jgi:hypothetical protein
MSNRSIYLSGTVYATLHQEGKGGNPWLTLNVIDAEGKIAGPSFFVVTSDELPKLKELLKED